MPSEIYEEWVAVHNRVLYMQLSLAAALQPEKSSADEIESLLLQLREARAKADALVQRAIDVRRKRVATAEGTKSETR